MHKSVAISLGQYEDNEEFKKAVISISRDLQNLPVEEVQKIAADIHQKAQSKREADFSAWTALGLAVIALGVGIALADRK